MARLSNARQRHSKRDEFPRVMRKFWQRPDENLVRARTLVTSIANSATVSWLAVPARHRAPPAKLVFLSSAPLFAKAIGRLHQDASSLIYLCSEKPIEAHGVGIGGPD
jgi:hypothetical protein